MAESDVEFSAFLKAMIRVKVGIERLAHIRRSRLDRASASAMTLGA